jgi:hypothetical protein
LGKLGIKLHKVSKNKFIKMFRLLATPEMVESDHVVESGSSNPFGQIGLTSVDVKVEPSDVSTSCKVDVVAFIRCEEVSNFLFTKCFLFRVNFLLESLDQTSEYRKSTNIQKGIYKSKHNSTENGVWFLNFFYVFIFDQSSFHFQSSCYIFFFVKTQL